MNPEDVNEAGETELVPVPTFAPLVERLDFEEGLYGTQAQRIALFEALSKAQGEFEVAGLDAENQHFGKKYAPLSSIVGASKAALTKYGLALIQPPVMTRELVTILTHVSGAFLVAKVELGEFKTIQDFGSRITYLRRYCRAALLGVAASDEEDDDGNGAAGTDRGNTPPPRQRPQERPPSPKSQGRQEPRSQPKPPEEPPRAEAWDPEPTLPDATNVRGTDGPRPLLEVMRSHIEAGIRGGQIPCAPNEPADSAGPTWVKALLKRETLQPLSLGEARTVVRKLRELGVEVSR